MSLVRSLVRGIASGGGGSTPDPELSYPSGSIAWDLNDGPNYGGFKRAGNTVVNPAGDGSIRGILPTSLTAADSLNYTVGTCDLLKLPWLGGCASAYFNRVMNPAYLKKAVTLGSRDWSVAFVFAACNNEGTNAARTGGGGLFQMDNLPVTEYMGIAVYRHSDDALIRIRRMATETATGFYARAGLNCAVITSTASALTFTFNGVTETYAALNVNHAGGSAATITSYELGRCLHLSTITVTAGEAVVWAGGALKETAWTPTEHAAVSAMLMSYYQIPTAAAATGITVVLGDSLPGFSGDVSNAGASQHTGSLCVQLASLNRRRIVYPCTHGGYRSDQIVGLAVDADRVVMCFGANDALQWGTPADPGYIANQATRRAAILANIEDRVALAKTEYPDAAYWYILATGVDQGQYDAINADFEDDLMFVRAAIVAAAGTGVWAGVTQIDAGTTYSNNNTHHDQIHWTSGYAAYIAGLLAAVWA